MSPDRVITVRRRDDALALTVTVTGFDLQGFTDGHPKLVRTAEDARIRLDLPPQHLGEQTFAENPEEFDGKHAAAYLAGHTRLVFVPGDVSEIDYDLASLLDLASLVPVVPAAALGREGLPPGQPAPALIEPGPDETALEIPWRLVLAPSADQSWVNASGAVTRQGRTEVWHTRLGWRHQGEDARWSVEEYRAVPPVVRAVWSPDLTLDPLGPGPSPAAPRMLPDRRDRSQLVRASSDWSLQQGYVPRPFEAERLMLSSGGGWLAGQVAFDRTTGPISVESWKHRATLGRDAYVRIVKKGYLYPWGHQASLVQVSERRVHEADSAPVAVLAYEEYVVVRAPVRDYTWHAEISPRFGRAFPFRRIRVTQLVSASLDIGVQVPGVPAGWGRAFRCTVLGVPYEFTSVVTDAAGRDHTLGLPAVFVESTVAQEASAAVLDTWWKQQLAADDPLTRLRVQGQRIALTDQVAGDGRSSLETHFVYAGTQPAPSGGPPLHDYLDRDTPPYFPVLDSAIVTLAAAQGMSTAPLGTPTIRYDEGYLERGFTAPGAGPGTQAVSAAELFARLDLPRSLAFAGERSGGLAMPSFAIEGLSRVAGPVGDLAGLAAGGFNPAALFGADARLLGAVSLAEVIAPLAGAQSVARAVQVIRQQTPTALVTSFSWEPTLQPDTLGVFLPSAGARLALRGQVRVEIADPSHSTYELFGEMGGFALSFFGSATCCLVAHFDRLSFTARTGSKPTVDPALAGVDFAGPLSFVETIKDYVSFGGNGPFLELTPTRIIAGVAIALPSIQVGIFALQNLAIRTQLELSPTGEPARLRFALCSRTQPFLLTVSLFGGGGFFALSLSTSGLELVEAALEFGASASVDLGVASGGVSMLAGIYFRLEKKAAGNEVTLAGYFRMHGEMSVIGLISISLDFYLGIEYHSYPGGIYKVSGRASLHVEIKVFLFSTSVEVTCERRFGGTASDPRFVDQVSQVDWNDYCDAFAPLPA